MGNVKIAEITVVYHSDKLICCVSGLPEAFFHSRPTLIKPSIWLLGLGLWGIVKDVLACEVVRNV